MLQIRRNFVNTICSIFNRRGKDMISWFTLTSKPPILISNNLPLTNWNRMGARFSIYVINNHEATAVVLYIKRVSSKKGQIFAGLSGLSKRMFKSCIEKHGWVDTRERSITWKAQMHKSRWVGISDPGHKFVSQLALLRGYVGLKLCSPRVLGNVWFV